MNDFIEISRYAGMREDLIQAGGGNSSYKESDSRMLIKASGYQLADISESTGYSVVDHRMIKDFFMNVENMESLTETECGKVLSNAIIEGSRPSIETFLHAISGKYTLHTHPIVVNALTSRDGGMAVLEKLFPEAILVPYATPGVELAKVYFSAYKNQKNERNGNVFFLKNHGLVVSGENAEHVIAEIERITRVIEDYLETDAMMPYHRMTKLWKQFKHDILWKVTDENVNRAFRNIGEWNHTFCPDCVVFLGKKFLFLDEGFTPYDIELFIEQYGMPVVIKYFDCLYIRADSVKKALEIQSVLSFSSRVMELNFGRGCDFLTDEEQDFLINWDAEKYRKNIK